ncbi:MAG: DUF6754 domain-containing protein [Anaerolineales bacterium]
MEALLLLGAFVGLLAYFSIRGKDNPADPALRPIKSLTDLKQRIELAVEDGTRLQVSLGAGSLLGPQSAAAFAGLTLLRQIADTAADSDQPPLATTGDGTLMLLAQDTLRGSHRRMNIAGQYNPLSARVTGLTPFSYAAGAIPLTLDRSILSSALVGSFGNEAALFTAARPGDETFTVGGSDSLSTQALLFASADAPLMGEEIYATGAYLGAGLAHKASLHAQDILRWVIIFFLIIYALLPLIAGSS